MNIGEARAVETVVRGLKSGEPDDIVRAASVTLDAIHDALLQGAAP